MRVTQMMLSQSSLRNINQGYNRLATIQDQLATGKKITRASQDPVVAMKGMRYRSQVTEVEQFKRNLSEAYNWMDTADATLDKGTEVLQRIRELATQAANDTYNPTERANVAKEVAQLREHLESLGNTKNSNKYIFNGTNTTNAPIQNTTNLDRGIQALFDGTIPDLATVEVVHNGKIFKHVGTENGQHIFQDATQTTPAFGDANFNAGAIRLIIGQDETVTFLQPNRAHDPANPASQEVLTTAVRSNDIVVANANAVSVNSQSVEIELLKGVSVPVNINPSSVFSNALFGDLLRLERALEDGSVKGTELSGYIDNVFGHIDRFVTERAELGARINRVQMIENRLMEQEVSANRIMSENEDAEMEKVIIALMTQESIHRAALSSGARIIQPSLMDFLR
ncbi:flagellar hook-associated protein FlgL [Halalkalibacter akibai]|uniref:Flagellar hook-associated protein FlgL n=1 Tax=Halalkalibacter akibai (strain ATCC 43226 / DSM 21942 / CIP 109018 / JCM 9157 / 1139) TaxID=1236973 RepID=W4QLP1_HALA3|nr:flagellar hook-associated protein FlgL [Halalkalibacter akibai]GAE33030.1 flagellar hook-associated protein FlgL [Halalkalibacter akibai JCM 9157]